MAASVCRDQSHDGFEADLRAVRRRYEPCFVIIVLLMQKGFWSFRSVPSRSEVVWLTAIVAY
jgi:hypothetical protein